MDANTPAQPRSPTWAQRRPRLHLFRSFSVCLLATGALSAQAFVVSPPSSLQLQPARSILPGHREASERGSASQSIASASADEDARTYNSLRSKVQDRKHYRQQKEAVRYEEVGIKQRDQGMPIRATEAFRKSIACDPSRPSAHYLYANLISGLGLRFFDEAVASYRTAIMLSNDNDKLIEYLSDFALTLVHIPSDTTPGSMLQVEEAMDAYELAISLKPQKASLYYEYAVFLEEFGNPAKATSMFDKADELTTAEIAAEMAKAGDFESEAKGVVVLSGASTEPLETAPSKPAPAEYRSRVPFLFWA